MESYLRHCCGNAISAAGLPLRTSLTISRQCGAGLSRFSRRLVEYLENNDHGNPSGWVMVDQSLIGRLVEEGHFPPRIADFTAGGSKFPVSPILVENLNHSVEQWSLFNHSANTIRTLCRHGNAIIVGRAGNFITSDLLNTFHVRLVAEKERRVTAKADQYRIGTTEATEMVDETDRARTQFVKKHTGMDIDDPSNYHLVINADSLGDELVVRIIADSLHEWNSLRKH